MNAASAISDQPQHRRHRQLDRRYRAAYDPEQAVGRAAGWQFRRTGNDQALADPRIGQHAHQFEQAERQRGRAEDLGRKAARDHQQDRQAHDPRRRSADQRRSGRAQAKSLSVVKHGAG